MWKGCDFCYPHHLEKYHFSRGVESNWRAGCHQRIAAYYQDHGWCPQHQIWDYKEGLLWFLVSALTSPSGRSSNHSTRPGSCSSNHCVLAWSWVWKVARVSIRVGAKAGRAWPEFVTILAFSSRMLQVAIPLPMFPSTTFWIEATCRMPADWFMFNPGWWLLSDRSKFVTAWTLILSFPAGWWLLLGLAIQRWCPQRGLLK